MATAAPAVRRVNLPVLILGAALALAGFGVTLLLALNSVVKMLGNYARLHYRLLKPEQDLA